DGGLREEAVRRHLDDARQLHAADLVVLCGSEHARLHVRARRRMAALGQVHLLAVEPRLLGVGNAVERRELVACDLLAGVEHRVEGVARMIGEARPCAQRFDSQPVVEEEVDGPAVAHHRTIHPLSLEGVEPGLGRPGARARGAAAHSTSNTPAAPMPPPMHIVTTTFFAPRRLPSMSAWPVRRCPLTPYG